MQFLYIELVNCNRTALNGKKSVKITPETKTQMVLGTNGSGKSSLISIGFSPLPPDPDDFDKDGYWCAKFVHKGHTYKCEAWYGDKNSYSFIVDGGENLNKGRTITAQLELVKIHTGYTRDLHALLTGEIKFTTMNALQRQQWISRFATADFTYAFAKYKEWRGMLSKANNIVDWVSDHLVEAKSRLMDPADVADMRKKADELHETLDTLMREPKSGIGAMNEFELQDLIRRTDQEICNLLMEEYPEIANMRSQADMDFTLAEVDMIFNQYTGEMKVHGERLSELETLKVKAQNMLKVDPNLLQGEIDQLRTDLNSLPALVTGIHESLLKPAADAITDLRMGTAALPPERKTLGDVMAMSEVIMLKRVKQNQYGGVIDDIQRQIQYIHQCESVSCPRCAHAFKPGVEPGTLEELESRLSKGEALTKGLDVELEELSDKLETVQEVANAYEHMEDLRRKYQGSYPGLFSYLDQKGWTSIGRGLSAAYAAYERDVHNSALRKKAQERLDIVMDAISRFNQEGGEMSAVMENYYKAKAAYEAAFANVSMARDDKANVVRLSKAMQDYERRYSHAEELYETLRVELIRYCNNQGDLLIEDLIKKTKTSIGIHENALAEQDAHETLVKDLENQLVVATTQQAAMKKLVDAMCPKKGLLAEQITHQMLTVINVVNKIIQRVWEYPLFVSPSNVDEEKGIDYKFPLTVDKKRRSDIIKGNGSSKDIVDQAFRLAGYACMNLTDYPLYLDELGSSFDETHQFKLLPLIKELADDPRFSQILIISHALISQTAFPSSQTIILDSRNINYPHTYNEHVEFA